MAEQIRFTLFPNRYHKPGVNPETNQLWDKRPVATGKLELGDDIRLGQYKAAAWRYGDRLNVVLTPIDVTETGGAEQTEDRQPMSNTAQSAPPPSSPPPPQRPKPLRDNLDI